MTTKRSTTIRVVAKKRIMTKAVMLKIETMAVTRRMMVTMMMADQFGEVSIP